jgi:hypothetical protein
MNFLRGAWAWFLARKLWQKILIVILALSVITAPFGGETSGEKSDPSATPEQSESASPTPTESETQEPEVEESPSASTSASPVPLSPVEFRASALGDLADMRKDLADAKTRINEGGLLRLLGNALELQFNVGQLKSITPMDDIADSWSEKLAILEKDVDKFTEGLSEDSVSGSRADLDRILKTIGMLEKFVKSVG